MDDEQPIRNLVKRVLAAAGYEVHGARDGEEALSLYHQAREEGQPFDLLILDLHVPNAMGGAEAIRELRAIDPGVKILAASGTVTAKEFKSEQATNPVVFLPKPYEIGELRNIVDELVAS